MASKLIAFLLWFFLGFTGIHLLYVKRYSQVSRVVVDRCRCHHHVNDQAMVWWSTGCLCGVGWLYDGYNIDKYVAEVNGAGSCPCGLSFPFAMIMYVQCVWALTRFGCYFEMCLAHLGPVQGVAAIRAC